MLDKFHEVGGAKNGKRCTFGAEESLSCLPPHGYLGERMRRASQGSKQVTLNVSTDNPQRFPVHLPAELRGYRDLLSVMQTFNANPNLDNVAELMQG